MPAKASRAAFGEALLDLGARDERIVTLDADLSKSTMTAKFARAYPSRAFNVGIAESTMIGMAAGLALTGHVPFACSFACFLIGRFETIRVSVAYTQAPVKLVGTHVGAIGKTATPGWAWKHRLHPLRKHPDRPAADEIGRSRPWPGRWSTPALRLTRQTRFRPRRGLPLPLRQGRGPPPRQRRPILASGGPL